MQARHGIIGAVIGATQASRGVLHLSMLAVIALGMVAAPLRAQVWPASVWLSASPEQLGMDATRTAEALGYGSSRGGSSILVRAGKIAGHWGNLQTRYDVKSLTKSIGSILVGIAIKDRLITLDTELKQYVPDFGIPPSANIGNAGLDIITVGHLATHTGGFPKSGGFGALFFEPGSGWSYSDGGVNWLADLLTLRFARDLRSVLRSRVLAPMGVAYDLVRWRRNIYRPTTLSGIERRELASEICIAVGSERGAERACRASAARR